MGTWLFVVIALSASFLLVVACGWWQKCHVRRHMEGRQPLTDEEFGRQFFSPDRAAIAARIRQLLSVQLCMDLSRLHPDDKLMDDIRMDAIDSLASVELLLDIEKEFGISIPDAAAQQMSTLRDIVDYVVTHRPGTQMDTGDRRPMR